MNQTEKDLIKSIGDILLVVARKEVMGFIVAEVPALGVMVVNPIVGFFVGIILNILINKTETGLEILISHLQVLKQKNDFLDAVSNYNLDKSLDNKQALIDSFKKFAKFEPV